MYCWRFTPLGGIGSRPAAGLIPRAELITGVAHATRAMVLIELILREGPLPECIGNAANLLHDSPLLRGHASSILIYWPWRIQ